MLCYTLLPDKYSSDDYAKLYSDITDKLPDFRRKRAEKLIPSKERAVNALSFFLLCHVLSQECPAHFSGMSLSKIAKKMEFSYSDNGKPYLNPPFNDIYFNISHSHNAIACAVAPFDVGIDIQDVRTPSAAALRRFLPSSEKTLTAEEFSMLWSRYEAFVKLSGVGITRSFADCEYLSDDFLKRTHTFINCFCIECTVQKKTAAYLATAFDSSYSDSFLSPVSIDFSRLCELALL